MVDRAYVIIKKEVVTSGMVVTGTLFLDSKSFYVLFNSGATHSFIFTHYAMQLNLEIMKVETNYRIQLSNDSIVKCPISYQLVPITTSGLMLRGDLI